ncbi:putative aldouronate transport system permease protein [Paenibacillus catalpae]|jgi:putative aldouronate transport system permease protein|uniref:Putative aldouronate transport system permease protein n=1 Tax=Paenibacillus catalpae TaxID=1045775 RepID=A0A1I2B3V5_9BACL|nr:MULTISPECIES: carbohydrate ABC transporter permease [Paenibacillus]NIK24369.1 putative aldouronate transport system permease protein [Paenibacillus lupini]SFE50766.1 putative aldouronate transport system permease protein [Paenibacillus catalpae]
MLTKSKIREPFGDRVLLVTIYVLLGALTLTVLYPLLYILSSSLSSPNAVVSGQVWLYPVEFSLKAYKSIFQSSQLMLGYYNSIVYTVVGTFINVSFTVLMAFPLSQRMMAGRKYIMILMMITMFFSGGLIPTYLLVKNLHLLDTRWALWLPSAFSVFQVIIARTFFMSSIPTELQEAAQMDGCRDTRYLWSIVLPLSKPILAVMTLMYAVGHWNAYFDALIYLRSEHLFPLQYVLRNMLILNAADPEMLANTAQKLRDQGFEQVLKYALIVVACVPVLIMYPFVQKHFVKGVMIGSLKG